jgi:hypothetical protein
LSASIALVSGMKPVDATESPDRFRVVFCVRAGEYGATVRDEGHPGANAGRAGRSYTLRFERVLVLGRPCD